MSLNTKTKSKSVFLFAGAFVLVGASAFGVMAVGEHPERAWQAYLINFLLWSAIAQGALLFSAVMHITNAKWDGPLRGLSESFAGFFPISLALLVFLFLGSEHIFPWKHHNLHGKEVWLNIPFLFSRDFLALLILYIVGFAYLFFAWRLRQDTVTPQGKFQSFLVRLWSKKRKDHHWCHTRASFFGVLYILAYTMVLSLLSVDLVMSLEPHWMSTLFAPYHFVKAFYIGLGALVIIASVFRLFQGENTHLSPSHFHDLGKLFFAFCLLWADFFYCQLVVIWYGNISEETSYIIKRTMMAPWRSLAWTVFILCFFLPFFMLLNKNVKTKSVIMIVLASIVITGIWLEHYLLIGPALFENATDIPIGFGDGLIALGFLGLMVIALVSSLGVFPPSPVAMKQEAEKP